MIIPFVNWGWKTKKKIDVSMKPDFSERHTALVIAQNEYDKAMKSLEDSLSPEQMSIYYNARNAANRVMFAQERMRVFDDINNLDL